jgi:hypothetical protein
LPEAADFRRFTKAHGLENENRFMLPGLQADYLAYVFVSAPF